MEGMLQGVLELLESAEILLDNGGNEAICAGLYTYAMEEYGKFLLVKQSSRVAGKVKIKYRKGFRNHPEKFRLAIENLPNECTNLGEFGFEKGFEQGFERGEVILNLEARMAVFYCDFTDSGDGIKSAPPVNKTMLKNAINKLRMIVLGINVNT